MQDTRRGTYNDETVRCEHVQRVHHRQFVLHSAVSSIFYQMFLWFGILFIIGVSGFHEGSPAPRLIAAGHSTKLSCYSTSKNTTLHTIKWYKDGKEFCRYSTKIKPKTKFFTVNGVKAKSTQCANTTVKLDQVDLATSGLYTCQMFSGSSDRVPVMTKTTSLVVYPRRNPVITGLKGRYEEGDMILANCTSAPSNPPPSLIWYINGILAEGWSMQGYPCLMTEERLCVLRLGLKLPARRDLFPRGVASLMCEAGLLALPPRRSFATISLALTPGGPAPSATGVKSNNLRRASLYWIGLIFQLLKNFY